MPAVHGNWVVFRHTGFLHEKHVAQNWNSFCDFNLALNRLPGRFQRTSIQSRWRLPRKYIEQDVRSTDVANCKVYLWPMFPQCNDYLFTGYCR